MTHHVLARGDLYAITPGPHADLRSVVDARRRPEEARALRQAATLDLPLVAIGGITTDNGASLEDAGADWLAVISAVFDAPDVRVATQGFSSLFASRTDTP